jgi:DNA-binding PadR family transcriptional regulator
MRDTRRPEGSRPGPGGKGPGVTPDLPPHWFQILLALADQDRHGLGIMSDVLDRTGGRMKLWPGMLYRNLSRLAEEGLVVEVETPAGAETGGGRPRFYRITPLGRRACAAEAQRLAGFVETARQKKLLKA